jgi:hypothetical protein
MFAKQTYNVIASEAKQSRKQRRKRWIASSLTLFAMTETKAENTDETAKRN